MTPAPLLTLAELAARLSCSRELARTLCDRGEIASIRIGTGKRKQYRITEEAIADYLRRAATKTPAASPARKRREGLLSTGYDFLRSQGARV